MSLLYQDKTKQIRGGLFEVHNEIGLGKRERAYQKGLEMWLKENDIGFSSHPVHQIVHRDREVHQLIPDFTLWDSITLELKAEKRKLNDSDHVQIFDYLRIREDQLGIIANMGLPRVEIERVIYDQPNYQMEEDWSYWEGDIAGVERKLGNEIRDGIRNIFEKHGTGFSENIIRSLLFAEFDNRGIDFETSPRVKANYRGDLVDQNAIDCLIIEQAMVVVISALLEDNRLNISFCKSFLKDLKLKWGIAVNFGKKKLQINGLAN